MKRVLLGLLALTLGSYAFATDTHSSRTIPVEVTENGFVPSSINVEPETHLTLEVTRKTDATCSTEIQAPLKSVKKALPLSQAVKIELGAVANGEIRFGCGMTMMNGGKINVS